MKDFLLKSNQFLGKLWVKYAQYTFLFIAILVIPLETVLRAVLLFVALFLCRLPLLYDIISFLMMTAGLVLYGLSVGFANWFTAVYAVWALIEIIKFLPFFVLKEEDIPLPKGMKIEGDALVKDDAPPEDARKFWD